MNEHAYYLHCGLLRARLLGDCLEVDLLRVRHHTRDLLETNEAYLALHVLHAQAQELFVRERSHVAGGESDEIDETVVFVWLEVECLMVRWVWVGRKNFRQRA